MAATKRIGLDKPVEVRMTEAEGEEYMVIIRERTLEIRPKRSRKDGSTVFVTIGSVYRRALMQRAREETPKRRRPVSRGMLATERRRRP